MYQQRKNSFSMGCQDIQKVAARLHSFDKSIKHDKQITNSENKPISSKRMWLRLHSLKTGKLFSHN